MRRLFALTALLALSTGCLKFERTRFSFDFKARTGEVRFVNIMADKEENAAADWAELVNEYILGTKIDKEHPTWQIVSKKLEPGSDTLDGVISLNFNTPSDVGIFQYDKKAPYFWCAKSDETILGTDGRRATPIETCVAWDRKAKTAYVEVQSGDTESGRSLLPEFQSWDGKKVAAVEGAAGALGSLEKMTETLGQAFAGALSGGPMVIGGLKQDQVMQVFEPNKAKFADCGVEKLEFEIGVDGRAQVEDGDAPGAACVAKGLSGIVFPKASSETAVVIPL